MPESSLRRIPRYAVFAGVVAGLSLTCSLVGCGGSSTGPTSPSSPPSTSSSCRTFTAAGSYTLDADIGVAGGVIADCLTITSSDVSVDCAHHVVDGGVTISRGISRVSIVNCVIPDYVSDPTNLTGLTIANSTLSNTLVINNAQNAIIRGNHISTDRREGAVLLLRGGSGNQVLDNVLDGGYQGHDLSGHGNDTTGGADDGIVLDNETSDIVQRNTIMNVFDAGVEGLDSVTGTTIADNTITRAVFAGIGSYWCTHWQGDTISANTISQCVQAITVDYMDGGRCAQPSVLSGAFADNTITDNVLRNQLLSGSPGISIVLPSIADLVTNNLIRGNDVASANIFVLPLSGFMNGGGNVCGTNGNFAC